MKSKFEQFYLAELEARMERSQVVGSQVSGTNKAVMFYDRQDGLFTLLVKSDEEAESTPFDCRENEQWGRKVMVLGHKTAGGGFIAQGHAIVDADRIGVKLTSGLKISIEADCTVPFLKNFLPSGGTSWAQVKRGQSPAGHAKQGPRNPNAFDRGSYVAQAAQSGNESDEEDFSEEDLARLRGDLPVERKEPATRSWQRQR